VTYPKSGTLDLLHSLCSDCDWPGADSSQKMKDVSLLARYLGPITAQYLRSMKDSVAEFLKNASTPIMRDER
jgi:hypothetical protein